MSVEETLSGFWDSVIRDAKKNLRKKNASGKLSKSLDYKIKVSKNSFESAFYWADYGEFIDQGVKGVGGKKKDGTTWKKKKVFGSRFKYKRKMPPARAFDKWSIRKGIAPRTKSGKFVKRKALNFAIARSVFHTGLETTHFLTKPFEKHFKQLPEEILEAYALDVENLLETSISNATI